MPNIKPKTLDGLIKKLKQKYKLKNYLDCGLKLYIKFEQIFGKKAKSQVENYKCKMIK